MLLVRVAFTVKAKLMWQKSAQELKWSPPLNSDKKKNFMSRAAVPTIWPAVFLSENYFF